MGSLITLLTDFGTRDGYVGAMKGQILSRAPAAQIVDLTHDIPPQDIRAGQRALRQAVPWFPPGSVHLAVVDPGVGTERRPLLLRAEGRLLVGPDNGLFGWLADCGAQAWVLDREELFAAPVSATFHGRDLFAAVAGSLAAGRAPEACGSPTREWVRLPEPVPRRDPTGLVGEVVHVDRFGNLITNIARHDLAEPVAWQVSLGQRMLGAIHRTYGEVAPGEWLAYWGSGGALEIAVREGSAAAQLKAPKGLEVRACRS